ncbi:MAG: glycosyltransferase family 2 protein [Desulfobacteraceae bacterium]|nr:glycosyltransferase family 2 protein [Desulfobacteraceae bacterium]
MAPDLSILIPLYNEQDILVPNVCTLLRFLSARGLDAQVLLGSNGSTDATTHLGAMLQETLPRTVAFFHIRERGEVGRIFKLAIPRAASPFLICMDADLSVDLDFIPKTLKLLDQSDIVVGSKQSGSQSRSGLRRLASTLFIRCAQAVLGLPYDDYSIGAKGYRIDAVTALLPVLADDTNYVLDLLKGAKGNGLRISVLPTACADWRRSRFRLFREGLVRFRYLAGLWVRERKKAKPAASNAPGTASPLH